MGSSADLIRNIHGIAVAELGDEEPNGDARHRKSSPATPRAEPECRLACSPAGSSGENRHVGHVQSQPFLCGIGRSVTEQSRREVRLGTLDLPGHHLAFDGL